MWMPFSKHETAERTTNLFLKAETKGPKLFTQTAFLAQTPRQTHIRSYYVN